MLQEDPGGSWVWASLYLLLKRSHHVLKGCPFIEDLKMGAAYLCLKFAATGFIFYFHPQFCECTDFSMRADITIRI